MAQELFSSRHLFQAFLFVYIFTFLLITNAIASTNETMVFHKHFCRFFYFSVFTSFAQSDFVIFPGDSETFWQLLSKIRLL